MSAGRGSVEPTFQISKSLAILVVLYVIPCCAQQQARLISGTQGKSWQNQAGQNVYPSVSMSYTPRFTKTYTWSLSHKAIQDDCSPVSQCAKSSVSLKVARGSDLAVRFTLSATRTEKVSNSLINVFITHTIPFTGKDSPTISKVQLFNGGTSVGTKSSAPGETAFTLENLNFPYKAGGSETLRIVTSFRDGTTWETTWPVTYGANPEREVGKTAEISVSLTPPSNWKGGTDYRVEGDRPGGTGGITTIDAPKEFSWKDVFPNIAVCGDNMKLTSSAKLKYDGGKDAKDAATATVSVTDCGVKSVDMQLSTDTLVVTQSYTWKGSLTAVDNRLRVDVPWGGASLPAPKLRVTLTGTGATTIQTSGKLKIKNTQNTPLNLLDPVLQCPWGNASLGCQNRDTKRLISIPAGQDSLCNFANAVLNVPGTVKAEQQTCNVAAFLVPAAGANVRVLDTGAVAKPDLRSIQNQVNNCVKFSVQCSVTGTKAFTPVVGALPTDTLMCQNTSTPGSVKNPFDFDVPLTAKWLPMAVGSSQLMDACQTPATLKCSYSGTTSSAATKLPAGEQVKALTVKSDPVSISLYPVGCDGKMPPPTPPPSAPATAPAAPGAAPGATPAPPAAPAGQLQATLTPSGATAQMLDPRTQTWTVTSSITPKYIEMPLSSKQSAYVRYSVQLVKSVQQSNTNITQYQVVGSVQVGNPFPKRYSLQAVSVLGQALDSKGSNVGEAVPGIVNCPILQANASANTTLLQVPAGLGMQCTFSMTLSYFAAFGVAQLRLSAVPQGATADVTGQSITLQLPNTTTPSAGGCVLVQSAYQAYSQKVALTLVNGTAPAFDVRQAQPVCDSTTYSFVVRATPQPAWGCGTSERTQSVHASFMLYDSKTLAPIAQQSSTQLALVRTGCEASDVDLLTKTMFGA